MAIRRRQKGHIHIAAFDVDFEGFDTAALGRDLMQSRHLFFQARGRTPENVPQQVFVAVLRGLIVF